MIVDLSCPIELRGYELLMDDNGHTRAYIRLFNLSDHAVVAYSATTRWYNGLTRADVTENITVDEMLVEPRSGFKLVHSLVDFLNADHVEMYFTSITFEDGTVWKPVDGDLVDIGEQPVLKGEALDRLRAAAGDDAVQYPQTQKNFWRCVCGRINLLTAEECIRCGREQREVLTRFNEKAFSDKRSDGERRQRPAQAYAQEKRKKPLLRAGQAAVIVVLMLLLALLGFLLGRMSVRESTSGQPSATMAPVYEDRMRETNV